MQGSLLAAYRPGCHMARNQQPQFTGVSTAPSPWDRQEHLRTKHLYRPPPPLHATNLGS